ASRWMRTQRAFSAIAAQLARTSSQSPTRGQGYDYERLAVSVLVAVWPGRLIVTVPVKLAWVSLPSGDHVTPGRHDGLPPLPVSLCVFWTYLTLKMPYAGEFRCSLKPFAFQRLSPLPFLMVGVCSGAGSGQPSALPPRSTLNWNALPFLSSLPESVRV